jgi:hypothetical protein
MLNNQMIISQRSVQAHCNPRSCGCKELSRLRTDEKEKSTKAQQRLYVMRVLVLN